MNTFLVVVAVFFTAICFGYLKRRGNTKRLRSAVKALHGGAAGTPSWVHDASKQAAFMAELYQRGASRGLPELFIRDAFAVASSRAKLFASAYLVEQHGASLPAQASAVCTQLEKTWATLTEEERTVFSSKR